MTHEYDGLVEEYTERRTLAELQEAYPDPPDIGLGDGLHVNYREFKTRLRLFLLKQLGEKTPGIRLDQIDFICQPERADYSRWYLLGYFNDCKLTFEFNAHVEARWSKVGLYEYPRDEMDKFIQYIGGIFLEKIEGVSNENP